MTLYRLFLQIPNSLFFFVRFIFFSHVSKEDITPKVKKI